MPAERSQKDVWRLAPWLMIVLLFGNFVMMAYDARAENQERMIRVWTQALARFIQSPVSYASSAVSGFYNSVAGMRTAQSENDILKQKIQELEIQVRDSREMSSEIERLRELLDLKDTSEFKVLPAQVIGRDASVWFDTAIINRGSIDGVRLNMPVVVNGGLVGRVTAVSPLTAQIDLITRDKSGLGAIVGEVGNSDAMGVVRGTGDSDVLEMKYVPGYIEVKQGDVIYTTGQDGIYPAGLRVGEIVEVSSGSATVPHQISVRPSAKIHGMQEVGVLLYTAPETPDFERSLPNALPEDQAPGN
ncbi:MAG: rod shape-determining protein MreC [Acidobacteria bacterium]|nr:MAG: rod shape-determining protein MreC [Acidobacteriota bacterium]REK02967.1 MAG: rod shape-determining protein MreC [Acidobacteriota bacterium]REK13229.1 MAG: rod shape-determining protein MreC [Acidobacteriota bacterium]REK41223.1 MAG: rod shape-determining protein MreC [Acidobacteriota bacterium]